LLAKRRRTLHVLVDRISEEELVAAHRFLEYLAVSPAYRQLPSAPPDDEPVTEGDAAAIARAQEEIRTGKLSRTMICYGNSACGEVYLAGIRSERVASYRPLNITGSIHQAIRRISAMAVFRQVDVEATSQD
jgi:hypothetical protein